MLQGVREIFELIDSSDNTSSNTKNDDPPYGKIVIIGRGLDHRIWQESLEFAIV